MRSLGLAAALLLSIRLLDAQPAVQRDAPDFLQTDREAGFAKSGSQFCAPTAVSNSLMWLAENGYDDLRPAGSAKRAQIAMIRKLSNSMKTSPVTGTDPAQLLAGVAAYVEESGYTIGELSYEGWRAVPEEQAASDVPSLEDIMATVANERGAAWLNVGWYRYDEEREEYARKGGHWVTVVGYDGDELLIHDPSPSAGTGFRTQSISLEALTGGTLTGNQNHLPRSAEGYYEVGGDMAIGKGWTCILDGVVLMTLE